MNKWFLILVLVISISGFAATPKKLVFDSNTSDEPGVAKEVIAGHGLVHTIHLDEYLKNLDPDEYVEKMDSQGKNNYDIFIVYRKSDDGTRQLVMQLFDMNRDGKVDLVKHFEKGKLSKTEIDVDYDGIPDVVSEYDTKTGELKKKSQADDTTNIWKYYLHNELKKKEVDRNGDGKPDMWVYYRNGKVVRTEVDENFDGKKIIRIDGPLNPNKEKKTALGLRRPPGN